MHHIILCNIGYCIELAHIIALHLLLRASCSPGQEWASSGHWGPIFTIPYQTASYHTVSYSIILHHFASISYHIVAYHPPLKVSCSLEGVCTGCGVGWQAAGTGRHSPAAGPGRRSRVRPGAPLPPCGGKRAAQMTGSGRGGPAGAGAHAHAPSAAAGRIPSARKRTRRRKRRHEGVTPWRGPHGWFRLGNHARMTEEERVMSREIGEDVLVMDETRWLKVKVFFFYLIDYL